MNPAITSRFIFHVLYLVGVIQVFYYFTILPNEVAFWVDLKGNTYFWMTKQSLLIFQFVILTLLVLLINLFQTLIKRNPSFILIPKKNLWFSTKRIEAEMEFSRYLNLFGGLILFFLIFYFNSILEMNVQNNFQNVSLLKIIVVVFPLILLVIIIIFIRKFNKI